MEAERRRGRDIEAKRLGRWEIGGREKRKVKRMRLRRQDVMWDVRKWRLRREEGGEIGG